ncbi:hypothetical protein DBR43_31790 [Pedobacter sp. KBW06]|uniref:protein kinase domain-containing protein n=1 Tax=Pedobacter sp. KBW06 TaxID=2153359 RepID=UPI000F595048|nr:protein kinase family protein [Pedobacter sp. KBW06]RQO64864.1 hypothetical protein DBR43_31790 [Pedobacter sp. KBW06]
MDVELERSKCLLSELKLEFPNKYQVEEKDLLGFGSQAAVFKAKDLHRDIDVAIKIHYEGKAPLGSERNWTISSIVNHHQIAHTYTVESFSTSRGKNCIAVVTRFIPGKSLNHIWDHYEKLTDFQKEIITEDFVYSLVPSMLEILEFCHKLGYGHGDLNSGNVMFFISEINKRYHFTAILIDFDNATGKDELSYESEIEKIAADYPKLRQLINGTLCDWFYRAPVMELFDAYDNVQNFRIGYTKMISFIEIIQKPYCTTASILQFLKTLLPLELPRDILRPILNCLEKVAEMKNKLEDFKYALKDFDVELQTYEELADLRMEMTVIEHSDIKYEIYTKMFA